MVRTCDELVTALTEHDAVSELAVLLTGTSLVPPEDFTLAEGDHVERDRKRRNALERRDDGLIRTAVADAQSSVNRRVSELECRTEWRTLWVS